jgi:protein O-GlcNAc transferase
MTSEADSAEALYQRAYTLSVQGRLDEARAYAERCIALDPRHAEAHNNLGYIALSQGRFAEAIGHYKKAIDSKPDYAKAHYNLGLALASLGRLDEAVPCFQRALAIQPDFAAALLQLGNALDKQDRLNEAAECYRRAAVLQPENALAHFWLGHALTRQLNRGDAAGNTPRLEDVLASYRRALTLRPDFPEALSNFGVVLLANQRYGEAAAAFARLIEEAPDCDYAWGNLLEARLYDCDWTDYRQIVRKIEDAVRGGRHAANPYAFLMVSNSPSDQLACARLYTERCHPSRPLPRQGTRHSRPRIRLAYLSADFHDHPMPYLMTGLFETHDRDRFETFAYSFGKKKTGPMRERLIDAFDHFCDVQADSDRAIAEVMRAREIDIAVDLSGFTQGCRPGIFAYRAAPVQVSYMGFPGTLGSDYIDYIIADRHVIPRGDEAFYTEKVVRLPDTYWVTDYRSRASAPTPSRTELNLPSSGLVFCCFNHSKKINPDLFDIWIRLLKRIDGSVLWLLDTSDNAKRNLCLEAQRRGVAPDRLIFAPRAAAELHIARHREADLFLDTLPYNAHTTASDALWAGLPVVTCTGRTFAGRVATSLLEAAGMPELITHDLGEYEALAYHLATTPALIDGYKARLEQNRLSCPLFDTERFRRHIESAYVQMWERFQRGEPPGAFDVI